MTIRPFFGLDRWWKGRPLATQSLAFTGLVFVLLAVITRIFAAQEAAVLDDRQQNEDRLNTAELAATRLGVAMLNMETGARGFLLSDDRTYLEPDQLGRMQLATNLALLHAVTAGDANIVEPTAQYENLMTRWRNEIDRDLQDRAAGRLPINSPNFTAQLGHAKLLMDSARTAHDAVLRAIDENVAGEREDAMQELDDVRSAATAYRIGMLAIALVLSLIITRDITKTMRGIIRGATAVANGKYANATVTQGVPSSREVQQLAVVFDQLAIAVAEREDMLRRDIVQLKEIEQMKTDFVATVSHELRTPLTSIRGSLGLVLGGAAGELSLKTRDLLRIAFQNTERLVRLINNILDIEKIEAGHVDVVKEPCDLMQVIDTTVRGITPLAGEHDVRLVTVGPETLTIAGDSDRLVQVFTNLISNAIKFSPRGSDVCIEVETKIDVASVRVIDHGPGIAPEFQGRIFGKFQQGHRAGARTNSGTGLGLAIAKAIVELHSGTIRFETSTNNGTVFIVDFPYITPSAEIPTPADGSEPCNILIVEDDPGMLNVLRVMCEALGDVIGTGTAEEAWEYARHGRFDAMIIDPGLPGASGFDLIRQLRNNPRYEDVPIMVFSAMEYSSDDLIAAGVHASHVFIKSRHSEQDLVMRLRAAMSARRLTREVRRYATGSAGPASPTKS